MITAGIFSTLVWLYLMFAHGDFWRVKKHLPPSLPSIQSFYRVAVIVPARNEAEVITQSITSLLKQTAKHLIHIWLVDDGSTDRTAEFARRAAEQAGAASALTIIPSRPLPAGWTGKLWAVQQAIEQAREWHPQFFFLADADILHAPDNIATLIAIAENGAYDLVSFMVKLQCRTVAEKFLIPAFVFFFFKLYPPRWISDPRYKTAGAAGGSILVRPEALERAGGIETIRSKIIDDCALAQAVKQRGGRLWLGLTPITESLRRYQTLAQVERMIARTAFNQLRHSVVMLVLALVGLMIMYLIPPLLLFAHHWLASLLGASAWLLMALAYLPMVRLYRLNSLWSLALPLIAIFYMSATIHSAIKYWTGHGGEWKGRTQDRLSRVLPPRGSKSAKT